MVYVIGLTGNIASGKSTAASIFSEFGIDVINADKVARELTALNTYAYHQILARYREKILLENSEINRRHLRTIIFSDSQERIWLENLLHPLIRKEMERLVNLCKSPYCVLEIPLLTDKTNYPYINKILLITASHEIQIARVMERDQCNQEQAEAILSTQPDNAVRIKNADIIINNDSDIQTLQNSLQKLHYQFLKTL